MNDGVERSGAFGNDDFKRTGIERTSELSTSNQRKDEALSGRSWLMERRRSRRDLTLKIENLKNKHHTNEDYHPIILRETHLNQSVRSHLVIIFLQEFFFIFFH